MPTSLAAVSIHTVNACGTGAFRWPNARAMLRVWLEHAYAFECALVFFTQTGGVILEDVGEIIFDPWVHGGIVFYGDTVMYASGRNPETVAYAWLPRAQARGL